jgi:hypothetical protein
MKSGHRKKARAYKQELLARLFKSKIRSRSKRWLSIGLYAPHHHNIVGVGFGRKHSEGNQITAPEAVRVYVRKKLAKRHLSKAELIPSEINGLPTDVIEVGRVRFLSRPTDCGVSIAHFQAHAGTLGCMVRRVPNDGKEYVLSNNHVLANTNKGNSGDIILQPAVEDGGNSLSGIAHLSWRMRLLLAGNVADVATGQIIFDGTVLPEIRGLGRVNPIPRPPVVDLAVKKSGRSSNVTVGTIIETEADVQVPMGDQTFGFVEQIAVVGAGGPFALDGDSGSLVVDALDLRAVGLLFAGSESISYLNPIGPILDQLQIEII